MLENVLEEKIPLASAARSYGGAIRSDSLEIDRVETARLRREKRHRDG